MSRLGIGCLLAAGVAWLGSEARGQEQEVLRLKPFTVNDPFFRQPAERVADVNAPREVRPPETRWVAALLEPDPRVSGPDVENARKWYQIAADRGSAAAKLQLANLPQSR